MSSAALDIQIVSPVNLQKLENFFKDVSYRETIEFSANFNTRLCIERRLRLPFLDPQTGVAQSPSQLYMNRRQRMPGFRAGQLYTYPAARWRKSRRQYLNKFYGFPERPFQGLRKDNEALLAGAGGCNHSLTGSPTVGVVGLENTELNGSFLEESSSMGAFGGDTSDSKDSQQHQQHVQQTSMQHQQQLPQQLKEDLPKEWFYDDMDINDVDSLEEPKSPADDEYDYDPRYGSKKRRKRRGKRATLTPGEASAGSGRRRTGGARGRFSAAAAAAASADTSLASQLDNTDGLAVDLGMGMMTPTSSGRRPRGQGGTRGRRRNKPAQSKTNDPPSPGLIIEPPSFESAAAAVGVTGGSLAVEEHVDMRTYPKFL